MIRICRIMKLRPVDLISAQASVSHCSLEKDKLSDWRSSKFMIKSYEGHFVQKVCSWPLVTVWVLFSFIALLKKPYKDFVGNGNVHFCTWQCESLKELTLCPKCVVELANKRHILPNRELFHTTTCGSVRCNVGVQHCLWAVRWGCCWNVHCILIPAVLVTWISYLEVSVLKIKPLLIGILLLRLSLYH